MRLFLATMLAIFNAASFANGTALAQVPKEQAESISNSHLQEERAALVEKMCTTCHEK